MIAIKGDTQEIGIRIHGFIDFWAHNRSLPDNIKHRMIEVFQNVLSRGNETEIWRSVAHLIQSQSLHESTKHTSKKSSRSSGTSSERLVSKGLLEHWEAPYFGASLDALRNRIEVHEKEGFSAYYARTMVFVQSSGTGKSRLVDEFGQTCPMINFLLSRQDTFPPADTEALALLLSPLRQEYRTTSLKSERYRKMPERQASESVDVMWNHSIAVGFLQAAFEQCKAFSGIAYVFVLTVF